MNLKSINCIDNFKQKVRTKLDELRKNDPAFNLFIESLLKEGELYLLGGFLRNIANQNESYRDIDLISTLTSKGIRMILDKICLKSTVNRFGGIKVSTQSIEIDIWSIFDNWAFNDNRIKIDLHKEYRGDKLLKKIADGTFYNYDSLVMDIKTFNCSVSNYNSCIKNQELDILRKTSRYKFQNPLKEANILRAYFIKKNYKIDLSEETKKYIIAELENLKSLKRQNSQELILEKSKEYFDKYRNIITKKEFQDFLFSIKNTNGPLFEKSYSNSL